jgi:hypothetical protein
MTLSLPAHLTDRLAEILQDITPNQERCIRQKMAQNAWGAVIHVNGNSGYSGTV